MLLNMYKNKNPDPDGAYPQENLIRHPESGDMIPMAELLDDVHAAVRAKEIVRQYENPQAESAAIPEVEAAMEAGILLSSLESTVRAWELPEEKVLEDGRVLKSYTLVLDNLVDKGYRSVAVQLTYEGKAATQLVYGNASVILTPDGQDWPREYYFQASTEQAPHIYYADYPWHEEELAQPQKDTAGAVTSAEQVILLLPRSS